MPYLIDNWEARLNHLKATVLAEAGLVLEELDFALDSNTGAIIFFNPDFQEEVFDEYLAYVGLDDDDVIAILNGDFDPFAGDEEISIDDRDWADDLNMLGVVLEDGEITFRDMTWDNGFDTMELLDELGWSCELAGKDGTNDDDGVYYI